MIAPLPRTVAVVLDIGFGSRLASLAERAAVWIVDSSENRPTIESLWTARRTRGATYDVTVFRMIPGLAAEDHIDGVLRSAGVHVDPDEPLAPVGSVEVYGAELTGAMRAMFGRHDYSRFDPLDAGFRAFHATDE